MIRGFKVIFLNTRNMLPNFSLSLSVVISLIILSVDTQTITAFYFRCTCIIGVPIPLLVHPCILQTKTISFCHVVSFGGQQDSRTNPIGWPSRDGCSREGSCWQVPISRMMHLFIPWSNAHSGASVRANDHQLLSHLRTSFKTRGIARGLNIACNTNPCVGCLKNSGNYLLKSWIEIAAIWSIYPLCRSSG